MMCERMNPARPVIRNGSIITWTFLVNYAIGIYNVIPFPTDVIVAKEIVFMGVHLAPVPREGLLRSLEAIALRRAGR